MLLRRVMAAVGALMVLMLAVVGATAAENQANGLTPPPIDMAALQETQAAVADGVPLSVMREVTTDGGRSGQAMGTVHLSMEAPATGRAVSRQSTVEPAAETERCDVYGEPIYYYQYGGTFRVMSVRCTGSTLRVSSITVWWYKQPLTTSNATPIYANQSAMKPCGSRNNYCLGLTNWYVDSHYVNQTSAIFPRMTATFTNGGTRTGDAWRWYYNDAGYAYPMFTDTRGGGRTIPFRFPSTGWYRCEDNTALRSCPRGSTFPTTVRNLYIRNGWPIPPNGEVHHITPLEFGGTDQNVLNGVIIDRNLHRVYTDRFWPTFRPRQL